MSPARDCWCRGALTSGPIRTVTHSRFECVSTPHDGSEPTRLAVGQCRRCPELVAFVRAHGGALCDGCRYAALLPAAVTTKETPHG